MAITRPVEKMPEIPDSVGTTLKRILMYIRQRLDALAMFNRTAEGNILLQVQPVGAMPTDLFNRNRLEVRTDGSNALIGAVELSIRTVTVNTAIQATDLTLLVDATAANLVVFLPAANLVTGRIYCIKKIDASGNTVTITPNGANVIDGAATNVIAATWDSVIIQSNGLAWYLLSLT